MSNLKREDWKNIIIGYLIGLFIYLGSTFIFYTNSCDSLDTCLFPLQQYEKIFLIVFSIIFGLFIQEIEEGLYQVGISIIANLTTLFIFYLSLFLLMIADLYQVFFLTIFNFPLVFIVAIFGQILSSWIYKTVKRNEDKPKKVDYRRISDFI